MGIMHVINWNNLVLAVLIFVLWGLFGFSLAVASSRHYFESVRKAKTRLASFRVGEAMCFCCQQNHFNSAGKSLICDREIVRECIVQWYGSAAEFEARVQSSISDALAVQLGRHAFPYWYVLGSTSPMLWGEMDLFAQHYQAYHDMGRLYSTVIVLGWWLGGFPILVCLCLFLSERCCRPAGSKCWDALQTLAVALLVCPAYLAMFGYQIFWEKAWSDPMPGAVIFAVTTSAAAFLLFHPKTFKRISRIESR